MPGLPLNIPIQDSVLCHLHELRTYRVKDLYQWVVIWTLGCKYCSECVFTHSKESRQIIIHSVQPTEAREAADVLQHVILCDMDSCLR